MTSCQDVNTALIKFHDTDPVLELPERLQQMIYGVGLNCGRLPSGKFCCEEVELIVQLYDAHDAVSAENDKLRAKIAYMEDYYK